MSLRSIALVAVLAVSAVTLAQSWKDAYDRALTSVKTHDWAAAKTAFQEAIAGRPEDQASPTVLPGPITEPVKWRDGAPYSPNFGVAYCEYKLATDSPEADRKPHWEAAAAGFETLIAKGQLSPEAVYFLNQAYGQLNKPEKQRELQEKTNVALTWKVDRALLSPEEIASIQSAASGTSGTNTTKTGTGTGPTVTLVQQNPGGETVASTNLAGKVPVVPTKFALVIGNSETQMPGGGLSFATTDAMAVRDALVQNAGYDDKNVDLIINATSGQILKAAQAMAQRLPDDATLVIYFSGNGVNVDGKDYFAGIDAAMATDTSKMISKQDLYDVFKEKGARIFCFCESNRTLSEGRYFGMEVPISGLFAQCQATSPGDPVYATMKSGKMVGIYTNAFVNVLANFRSNRVSVTEFSWSVFYAMQGSEYGSDGSGSRQVPSMPVIRNLGNARF